MAAVPSIRVIKTMPFKGGTRQFSNRYHFNGGVPADATHWHTLMDAVVAAEAPALQTDLTIVEAVGYAAGSDVPVASKVYTTPGSCSLVANAYLQAGEVVSLVRYATSARSTKNHPIYCFNYYHGVAVTHGLAYYDQLDANLKSALATYAGDWISGFSDGTHTLVRASPNGAAATGAQVEEYVTHRDFPYSTSV